MARLFFLIAIFVTTMFPGFAQSNDTTVWTFKRTADFEIDGKGTAADWNNAAWLTVPLRSNNSKFHTRVKAMYSEKGMYFLFECEDSKITSTMKADMMDLWKEDVFEIFIQTDENSTGYFEYELSPNNYELPILISNIDGNLTRWMPFHYEADRKTKHATNIVKTNGKTRKWTGEVFIPFELLRPLHPYIAKPGTKWRGNFYRIDVDNNINTYWSWQKTGNSFHDIEHFGTFSFE